MSRIFYLWGKSLVLIFFFLFTRLEVIGRENVPAAGPLLVVCNHLSFADTPLLRISLRRESRFAARGNFFNNIIVRVVFKTLGGFPIGSGAAALKAVRLAQQYMNQGLAVVIFPEGTRSKTFKLGHGLPGAALFAQQTGAPILPIGITGTEKMRGLAWYFKRPLITIRFGAPFHLPLNNGKIDREAATVYIMERIAEQLPSEYRGVYAKCEAPG